MRRETIPVTGMSCTGCERTVESALQRVEGVTRAEADHEGDAVEVVVDDGVADEDLQGVADEDLQAAVERAGYDVAG